MSEKILLVGCGKMGGALVEGWLEQQFEIDDIVVVDPDSKITTSFTARGIKAVIDVDCLPERFQPDVVVFAVKPQVMDQVVPPYKKLDTQSTIFISIAAGKTVAYFEKILGPSVAIVRAMPNTPAAIRRGITVACGSRKTTKVQRNFCHRLLKAVGELEWVQDEGLIDAVTALSGGGPAYVFFLAEVMAKAGMASGLPSGLSERLARLTVAGAGELLYRSTEPASRLRENVTSPGGTTAEALKVLMADDGWQPLMDLAIAEATSRSKELEG